MRPINRLRYAKQTVDGLNQNEPEINTKEEMMTALRQMTFTTFIESVSSLPREKFDEHFRPQVDFLALENYTHWFSLEKFEDMESQLKSEFQFQLHDTRDRLRHDTHDHTSVMGDFANESVENLKRLKNSKKNPESASLYNERTRQLVVDYFAEDINLYRRLFGSSQMLFKEIQNK
jgi:hypothetical protein